MKLSVSYLVGACLVGLVACIMVGLTGCEELKGVEGLRINPVSSEVAAPGDMVGIQVIGPEVDETVRGESVEETTGDQNITKVISTVETRYKYDELALPFVWGVQDPALGYIIEVAAGVAVYVATSTERSNVVFVRDQYDNVGRVIIAGGRSSYDIALTASPGTTIEVGAAVTISIDNSDAIGPFTWRKVSGPGTVAGGAGGSRSAAYSSTVTGTGVIEVTDGNGVQGIIAIVVQDSSSGAGGGSGGPGGS
jgi:hypothetical protein